MFGYPAGFVGGNMFAGLHQENLVIRLDATARAELLAVPGASIFEPMPGRQMKEYVVAPPSVIADVAALRRWLLCAFAHAAALPEKVKKPRSTKSPKPKKSAAKPNR
jgi:hypothetical protein